MIIALLATHVAAMVTWVFAVSWEIKRNEQLIAADGAMDSLHEGFHRLRTFYRIMAAQLIAIVASLPLWHYDKAMTASMVGLLALFAGYFTRVFNTSLNIARGKAKFYASVDPHAALFPDRLAVYVAKECEREHGTPWAEYLPLAYEAILNVAAGLCAILYVAALATAIWLVFQK